MLITKKLLLTASIVLVSGTATAGDVLVYTGEGGISQGYTDFGIATGKTVTELSVLPVDLSPYDCVVLALNGINAPAFSPTSLTALTDYANAGGRIIAEADNSVAGTGYYTAMNGLAASLGSDLSVSADAIDNGFTVTTNIDPSPFTVGVSSVVLASTAEVVVNVGPNAHSLVRTSDGSTTMMGADQVGSGIFILSGDSNVFSDNSGDGYTTHDNGILAANVCDLASLADTYSCEYSFDPPFDAPLTLKTKKNGAIPVKMTLVDKDGFIVEASDLASMPVVNVYYEPSNGGVEGDATGELLPTGQANDDNIFRYDPDEFKFIYNMSTKPYKAAGTYSVSAVSSDSSYVLEGCSQEFDRL